jgi:hypothetical protein
VAQAFYATRISEHLAQTPEGYLLCRGVPLARSAEREPQMYRGSEVGLNSDDLVPVFRSRSAIFDKRFLSSLESKPVTDRHPSSFVTNENYGWHSRGHVRNVRPGGQLENGEYVVVGDVIVHDRNLAEKILSGQQREISLGYQYDTIVDADGKLWQTKLVGNHCAVVPDARGGRQIRIMDSKGTAMTDEERQTLLESIAEGIETLLRLAAAEESEDAGESPVLPHPRTPEQRVADAAWWKQLKADDPSDMAKHFHRRDIKDGVASYEAARNRSAAQRAHDSSGEGEDWFAAHREAGHKMRDKKH